LQTYQYTFASIKFANRGKSTHRDKATDLLLTFPAKKRRESPSRCVVLNRSPIGRRLP
jgi:hypothetical protein